MTAAYKIFNFSIVKNSCCDVIVDMKMFPFAKLFIEIIDNSQTKRVRDLKILPDLEQGLKTKISIFAKGNILRCSLLQNDGSLMLVNKNQKSLNLTKKALLLYYRNTVHLRRAENT